MDSERGRGTYARGRRGARNMRFRGRGQGYRGGYPRQSYNNRENGELNGKPTSYNSYSNEPRSNLTETENTYSHPTSSYRGGRASRGFRSQRNPNSAGQGDYQPRYNAGDSYQGASRYQYNPRDRDAENEKPREYSHNPSTGYDRAQRGFRSRARSRPYRGANRSYVDSSDRSGYPKYTQDRTQSAYAERAPGYSADRPAESPERSERPQRGESSSQYRGPGPDAGAYRGRGRGRRGFRRGYRNGRQNYNGGRSYESKHLTKISALEPMKDSLYVNCVALSDPVEIEERYFRGSVTKQWTVLVGDDTGCIDLKIHNSNVARLVKEGVSMTIQNGHIEMRDNRFMRLATYRGGFVSVLQETHVFKPITSPNYSIVEYIEE